MEQIRRQTTRTGQCSSVAQSGSPPCPFPLPIQPPRTPQEPLVEPTSMDFPISAVKIGLSLQRERQPRPLPPLSPPPSLPSYLAVDELRKRNSPSLHHPPHPSLPLLPSTPLDCRRRNPNLGSSLSPSLTRPLLLPPLQEHRRSSGISPKGSAPGSQRTRRVSRCS